MVCRYLKAEVDNACSPDDEHLFQDLFFDEGDQPEPPRMKRAKLEQAVLDTKSEGGSSGSGKLSKEVEHKSCLGCARKRGIGKCLFLLTETVKWPGTQGSGFWCLDCVTVFRTVYQGESHTSLAWFVSWLKVPENILDFEMNLCAYLTLKREDVPCVRKAMILERSDSLRLFLRLTGLEKLFRPRPHHGGTVYSWASKHSTCLCL